MSNIAPQGDAARGPAPQHSDRLAGRTAVITGAGGGLGAAFARHLAAAGADVLVADIDIVGAEHVAEAIRSAGGSAAAARVDVTEPDSITAMFDAAFDAFDGVDVLFNNAGVSLRQPFLTTTEAQWRFVHDVNTKGVLLCTQEAARRFIPRGGGKVVNTCSTSSRQASAHFAAYAASKAAVLSLTHSGARALAPHGITVNAIGPGIIDTGLWSTMDRDDRGDVVSDALRTDLADYASGILLGRVGRPDDVAPTAVFLASGDADYITGQLIMVDGGIIVQ
ncbi:SDR family NAD(P)-dependent oxidoreductase [Microbacterium sp.]|uniref:SDR family NAD(P)-dependent oxidoreductase n=1 Tax=Microbacterium sp. TaxID=51671 RepID=UPI003F9D23E0